MSLGTGTLNRLFTSCRSFVVQLCCGLIIPKELDIGFQFGLDLIEFELYRQNRFLHVEILSQVELYLAYCLAIRSVLIALFNLQFGLHQ